MNKHKYDDVAHHYLDYCSPINNEMVDEIAHLMRLKPGMTVIDLGCAKAEILIRMADTCQVQAYGADINERYLHQAQEAIANRVPAADITLLLQDVSEYAYEPESFDAVMCINSSELFATYDEAIMTIAKYAKPGGMVLMGDYYWRNPSHADMSKAFTVTKDYMGAVEIGMQEGLTPLFASVSTQVDIDRYIWSQCYAVEMYAVDHPDDDDVALMLDHARTTRSLYVEYGHETLGFGLFLFRKPKG
ncbi:MAG: methyltransferase domain-containing protein [Chloroflexota bacterium]